MNIYLFLLLLVTGLVGFVFVQIKTRLVWRLLSIAVVVGISCAVCYQFSKFNAYNKVNDDYVRSGLYFVEDLKKMAVVGRTNEIVQACEQFQSTFYISPKEEDISKFRSLVEETTAVAHRTKKP